MALVVMFAVAAGIVWWVGIKLSDSTDVLAGRLGLGEALSGLILLAIATNLPEIAITATAALQGNLGVAIGNILGGIAIQTVVLVLLDLIGVRGREPLTYRAASLSLVLEGVLVVAVRHGVEASGEAIAGHIGMTGVLFGGPLCLRLQRLCRNCA